jgi:hypothetical protein
MRNSLLISLLVFIVCAFPPVYGQAGEPTEKGKTEIMWKPVLPDNFQKGLFRMTFDISKDHISGFLLIKRTSDSSTSIIFTNEFGICFFNFEFLNDKLVIHSLFPAFDRKSLLKILEQDFRLILGMYTSIKNVKICESADPAMSTYRVSSAIGTWEYDVFPVTKIIKEIRSLHSVFRKTALDLSYYNTDIPGIINISHPLLKLKIKMSFLSP